MVVTTNYHCRIFIISGTIFYSWDYHNHIVKSTITILYYIFLVDIGIKNRGPLTVLIQQIPYIFLSAESTNEINIM